MEDNEIEWISYLDFKDSIFKKANVFLQVPIWQKLV